MNVEWSYGKYRLSANRSTSSDQVFIINLGKYMELTSMEHLALYMQAFSDIFTPTNLIHSYVWDFTTALKLQIQLTEFFHAFEARTLSFACIGGLRVHILDGCSGFLLTL